MPNFCGFCCCELIAADRVTINGGYCVDAEENEKNVIMREAG